MKAVVLNFYLNGRCRRFTHVTDIFKIDTVILTRCNESYDLVLLRMRLAHATGHCAESGKFHVVTGLADLAFLSRRYVAAVQDLMLNTLKIYIK